MQSESIKTVVLGFKRETTKNVLISISSDIGLK